MTQGGHKVFSWGLGKFGATGTSLSQNINHPVQIDIAPGTTIRSIAAGARHSAIIDN